jgi:integrase
LETRREIRGRAGLAKLFATPVGRIHRADVDTAIAATTSAPGMARETRKALSSAFGFAREALSIELPSNPAASSKLKRTRAEIVADDNGTPARALTREELQRLIDAMPPRYRALVELLGRVGLRPREAYALTTDRLDADACVIRIEESKTGRPRTIPIPSDPAERLAAHADAYASGGLVFPSETGRAIDDHNWRRRVFQPAAKRAGLNGIRPYDLHTACSTALSLGVDAATVANMSGHTVATLLRT